MIIWLNPFWGVDLPKVTKLPPAKQTLKFCSLELFLELLFLQHLNSENLGMGSGPLVNFICDLVQITHCH